MRKNGERQMTNGTMIVKRDGSKEHLNIDKIHVVVEHACEGLAGVSSSQIEMNANLQFYDNMSTIEIQEILIRSANDLISLEAPNYQYAAVIIYCKQASVRRIQCV